MPVVFGALNRFFAIFDTVRIFCELVFTLKVLCLFANLPWLYCTDLVN